MASDIRPATNPGTDADDLRHIPVRPFHTLKQIADILQFTLRHIYRLLKRGELKGYKFGQDWRVSHQNLLTYINSKRR